MPPNSVSYPPWQGLPKSLDWKSTRFPSKVSPCAPAGLHHQLEQMPAPAPDRCNKHMLGSRKLLIIIPLNEPWQAGVNLETHMLITHEAHNTQWGRILILQLTSIHLYSKVSTSLPTESFSTVGFSLLKPTFTLKELKRLGLVPVMGIKAFSLWQLAWGSAASSLHLFFFLYTQVQNPQHPYWKQYVSNIHKGSHWPSIGWSWRLE